MKDVGRHTYLARRPGTANWQFRARVPLDLVAHFGKREITKSLGTADHAEANRRVRDEADAFDKQCRTLRGRAASNGLETVGNVALTSLGEAAIREMVLTWFETGNADRERRHELALPQDRDEALITLDQDEQDLTDPDGLDVGGAYQSAVRILRANDVRLVRR